VGKKKIEDEKYDNSLSREENLKIKSTQRFEIMQKLQRAGEESKCIVLRDMVGVGEVDAELKGEVKEECVKFGVVHRVEIYEDKEKNQVNIFVLFDTVADAIKARESLDKRYFGGRVVQAEFFPTSKFEMRLWRL